MAGIFSSFIFPSSSLRGKVGLRMNGGGMDWKRAIEDERAAMQRIVALLLALADLAEGASHHSRAASLLMFWILHPAACAAWAFVGSSSELPESTARCGDVREDTMRLAERFRYLACIFEGLAKLTWRCSGDGLQSDPLRYGAGRMPPIATIAGPLKVARPVLAPDTS
jgi:hypothetical protein